MGKKILTILFVFTIKNSKYDQKMQQSQTADEPIKPIVLVFKKKLNSLHLKYDSTGLYGH